MKLSARLPFALIYLWFVASVGVSNSARAGSATWDLNPGSGNWNTATNWTPATVPNGSADTATFALSNTTAVSISANTTVDGITFAPDASSFTIASGPTFTFLTIRGTGVTNNSGSAQNFVTAVDASNQHGIISFVNSATAGAGTFFTNSGGEVTFGSGGGETFFSDSSSAGSATITNKGGMINFQPGGGGTFFTNTSTAANATITNSGGTVNGAFDGGFTRFEDSSNAGSATITSNAGTAQGAGAGFTSFYNSSSAGNGIFTNNPSTSNVGFDAGSTRFWDTSTAANAIFTNNGSAAGLSDGGFTIFEGASTAANGTFTNNGGTGFGARGGATSFFETSTAANGIFTNNGGTASGAAGGSTSFTDSSTADSATLIANGGTGGGRGGTIFFSDKSTGGTSRIEVFGNGDLDISGHDITRVIVGSIEGDGNIFLGRRNLTVGTNNMDTTFSGVIQNGGIGGSLTKVGTGTLDLMGTNTYTGNTTVNGGVLQIDGSITSNTFVHGRGTLAPALLNVNANYTQTSHATLLIDIAGLSTGQFSVLDVGGTVNLVGAYDLLNPILLNGFVPTVGDSFTFLNYTGLNGTFVISNANIDNLPEHWEVTYQPTRAILTVAPGNVPVVSVPDQAPTSLLLTLSLLGLMTYRCQLLRKSA